MASNTLCESFTTRSLPTSDSRMRNATSSFRAERDPNSVTVCGGQERTSGRQGCSRRWAKGVFESPRGQAVLKSQPPSITRKFLLQFPEFMEFQSRSGASVGIGSDTIEIDSTQTPEEVIEA